MELSNTHFNSDISSFNGAWTSTQAAHLLRRTIYGADQSRIIDVLALGLEASVDLLLSDIAAASPPLNFKDNDDPNVPIGETWVEQGKGPSSSNNNKRRQSIRAWTIGRALSKEMHIREKMTLFWHNHFVVADSGNALAQYNYINLLRTNCLGNLKQLTKDITIDPSMVDYLNSDENTKAAPNENFARELLELFTIGKGPLIGPGDYTNYTENDIKEMARVLTGWRDEGYGNVEYNDIHSSFKANRHDTDPKQLSDKFGNALIENEGEEEYKTLIDVIFQQDEVSRFMVRNLYRWFIHYNITDEIETSFIEPLAQVMRDNDYDIKVVMKTILMSEHFYTDETIGCMIKNPMDFIISSINVFNIYLNDSVVKQYKNWYKLYQTISTNQMTYFYHPSVAGWKPYYQSPGYYQLWLSSATLPLRQIFTDKLAEGYKYQNEIIGVDVLNFVAGLTDPTNINNIITGFEQLLFARPLSEVQQNQMKEIVLVGLPEFEWTVEYVEYINNPDDDNLRKAIENKLKLLTLNMMRLPEYQLS